MAVSCVSTHVSVAFNMNQIDLKSPISDFNSVELFTMGFGGLNMAKNVINSTRNHILSHNGMNYGIHNLRVLKNSSDLLDS